MLAEDHPILIVEDDETLRTVADRLLKEKVVGVDTESDSMYHYEEKVCLLQFTDSQGDIIVDPLAVDDLSPLQPLFADENIVKVFHGADYDVVCMKRDFDFQTTNLFDTLIAAQFLGLERLGLADLIDRFFGVPLDKQYQRHDWSQRPLLEEHLDYARGDTHFLLALREILMMHLRRARRVDHHTEECALVQQREWQGRSFDEDGYLRIKRASTLDDTGKRILKRLYLYRDDVARELDRPTFKVLSDRVLISVAQHRPSTRAALDRLFTKQAAMKRRHGKALIDGVVNGLEDDFEIPALKPKKSQNSSPAAWPARLKGRACERVVTALKDWRTDLVENVDGYTPFSVASNNTLKAIASHRPVDLDELQQVPDVRRWQVQELGEQILAVLDSHAPASALKAAKPKANRRRKPRRRQSA